MKFISLWIFILVTLTPYQALASSTNTALPATTVVTTLEKPKENGTTWNMLSEAIKIIFSWPGLAIIIIVLFYRQFKNLLDAMASSLKNSKLKKVGGIEFEAQHNENTEQFQENTRKNGEESIVVGNPDDFGLICKASNSKFTKSTKGLNLPNGCLIQVSTREILDNGSISVAEALSYIPDIQVNIEKQPETEEKIKVWYEKI